MADNSKPGAVKLFQAVNVLESLYPLEYAESWDNPGLIAGDLFWDVKKIRFAVDPTYETVAEAIEEGTDLLICHHPLFFRSVHQVSGQGFRGDIINRLIEAKCALWVGHTNADAAVRGQADAAAFALGLKNCEALVPIDEKKVRPADAGKPVGIGRVGYLETEMTLRQFAVRVHEVLQSTQAGIRVAGDLEAKISKVAVLPGSGILHHRGDQQPQRGMYGKALHVVGFQKDVIPDHRDLAHRGVLSALFRRQQEKPRAVSLHKLLARGGGELRGDRQHGAADIHQRRIAGERAQGIAAYKEGQGPLPRVPIGLLPDGGFQLLTEPGELPVTDRHAGLRNHGRKVREAFKIPEFSHGGSFHFFALSSFLRTSSRPVR